MNSQQLDYFMAVIRARNYTRAAKQCFTSRQNIAHAVKALENEFHLSLFRKEGANLLLTEAGASFAAKAQQIIDIIDDMHNMAPDNESLSIPPLVKVSTQFFNSVNADFSRIMLEQSDKIRFSEDSYGNCISAVRDGAVEGALVVGMNNNFRGCDVLPLFTSPVYALVGSTSPFAKRSGIKLSELANQTLLLVSDDALQFESLLAALQERNIFSLDSRSVQSTDLAAKLVVEFGCVGITSEAFRNRAPRETTTVPIIDKSLFWFFSYIYLNGNKASSKALSIVKEAKRLSSISDNDYSSTTFEYGANSFGSARLP